MSFDRGDNREMDIRKLVYLLHQFDVILSSIIGNKILFKNEQTYSMLVDEWKNHLAGKLSVLNRMLSLDQYTEPLKNAGLTGSQLTLKFNIFNNFIYGEVLNDRDFTAKNPPHKLPTLTERIISGFFDFFNSLLGSLSGVIPMIESIKEFKDMVHFEIKYGTPYENIK